jgi:endonuclease/exonuclease/phosphatase family metal-dependent hydrolase
MGISFPFPLRAGLWGFVLLFSFLSLEAHDPVSPVSQPQADTLAPQPLNILSWNIYMLPPLARITGKRQRAHAIANKMLESDYHILVFQEAFLPASRRIIRRKLKKTYSHEFGPACQRKFSVRTNSGIWILSKIPLEYVGEVEFEDCATWDDCFAHKGALMCEGEWEGNRFQVIGTHLNAGGPDSIKVSQYHDIHRVLLEPFRKDGVPQILCGDMNTSKTAGELYETMLQTFGCVDGDLEGDLQFTTYSPLNDMGGNAHGKIIDYIFHRDNGKPIQKIRRCIPIITHRWSKKHQYLSDHFPVEAKIWF